LHRKGLLERVVAGRAFAYRALVSPEQMSVDAAREALRGILRGDGNIEPVLSCLVDEVTAQDTRALEALERLVRDRLRALKTSSSVPRQGGGE
jgi:predicted transcriptional regulator